jgi:hypothetical protein
MTGVYRILAAGALAACLMATFGLRASADDTASEPSAKPAETTSAPNEAAPAPAAKPLKELSPALGALRDRVRNTLVTEQKQAFNTHENSATEIMSYCLAFGCGTEVLMDGQSGKQINGIAALCFNYPCAGFEMLGASQGHVAPRIGFGYQEHPGEFLAMLAMSRVQPNYPARLGKVTRSVADLVEGEKLGCRSGSDASLKLIGLAYYVDEPEWKNDLGETWSLDRIVEEELAQPIVSAPEGGLNRLLGLSFAVARRAKHGQPLEGNFHRAQKYVAEVQEFALRVQSADGSWGPQFLTARSTSQDAASQLRSSGRVLEWLAMSLPDKKLEDARVVNAVDYVTRLLSGQRYQWNAQSLPTQEIVALGHAVHALAVYDEREFKPADVPEKPAATEQAPATASSEATAPKSR